MKKLIALFMAMVMVLSFAACANSKPAGKAEEEKSPAMSYEEFMAAETDAVVCIDSYVQATQSWWYDDEASHGKVTVYLQDKDGAYFAYEVNMTEEEAGKLVPGTKVRVNGTKAEWAGEVEVMNGTIEILDGETFIAEAKDVTALMGTEDLEAEMNKLVTVKGMTFKSLSYKESSWDHDIYVTLTLGETDYEFCVENTLTGPDTEVYKAVEALQAGDVVDVTGYLYWYEGPNTHITSITKVG